MPDSEQGPVFDATSALLTEMKSVVPEDRVSVTTNVVAYLLSNMLKTLHELMPVLVDVKKLVVQEWVVRAKEQRSKEK